VATKSSKTAVKVIPSSLLTTCSQYDIVISEFTTTFQLSDYTQVMKTRNIGGSGELNYLFNVNNMNMSYCRFHNTLQDLEDCYENWENYGEEPEDEEDIDEAQEYLSKDEAEARAKLLALCERIVKEYGE